MPDVVGLPTRPPFTHRIKWHLRRTSENLNPVRYARMWRYTRHVPQVDLVIALPRLAPGGVERLMINLVAGLRTRGIRLLVLVTGLDRHTWVDQLRGAADVVVLWDRIPPRLSTRFVEQTVRRSGAKAFLITNSEPAYAALPLIKRADPTIRTVDILHTIGRPEENNAFLRIRSPFREHLDLAVTVSGFLRQYMLDRSYESDPDRVRVIPNVVPPVDTGGARPARSTGLRILWLGRIDEDKDPLAVLDVAASLQKSRTTRDVSISIAGDGPLLRPLASRLREHVGVRIDLLGHVDDVTGLLASHDVMLNTSPLEGQPLSVLEALQAGLPVVAYKVGGLPELADGSDRVLLVPRERGADGLALALLDAPPPAPPDSATFAERWSSHLDAYLAALCLNPAGYPVARN